MNELVKIKKILQESKPSLKRQFKIKDIGIFGSYVRGKNRSNSDVDILVTFSRTPGFFDYLKAEAFLSRILNKRVDLVMKGSLKPTIGKHILREVFYV